MDGLDIEAVSRIDDDIFKDCPDLEDEEELEELPVPDCIGVDSALQDEELSRLNDAKRPTVKSKTKSEVERELELKMLNPNSIRSQILEKSLSKTCGSSPDKAHGRKQANEGAHVMNIVEKAGMHGIDKDRINEIIHEASKGSLFYKKQAQRQEEIHKSIEKMLNKVKIATASQVESAKDTCERLTREIEKQRLFNRIIVHFDLDMFFAAVEIRDNPGLADKPIAVGGDSMVSTSNYVARRFGVRAAMPGFIAKKLCPDLILIKPDGVKYRQASSDIFSILERYDSDLTSMSLDEAYLDLTEYVKNTLERDGLECEEYYDGTLPKIWWTRASDVVEEIRDTIYRETKLTCSAGIACNTLLAKISTDIKKPNGQFMVEGYPKEIMSFIRNTPVGKVSGIGKVSGQFLSALDIKTCGDLYDKRHFLPLVFYEINVRFYLRVALGDGSTCIKSDESRKSKSVERTFTPTKDTLMLLDKLDSICDQLCNKYLRPYRIRGRTVTLKLKRNTFTTTTRSYSMLVSTNDKAVIYSAAKNLLLAEIANEPPEISYRLLGVRISNLADDSANSNQLTIDSMLRNQELSKAPISVPCLSDDSSSLDTEECSKEHNEHLTQEVKNHDSDNDLNRESTQDPTSSAKRIRLESTQQEQINRDSMKPKSNRVSYYQKFMETNLKRLSKSPKIEPFQCPYCLHGFLNFSVLETHVSVCNKKNAQ